MKSKKLISTLLVTMMLSTVGFAGCGKSDSANATPKVLDYYSSDEPETLDAQQITGNLDLQIANMFIEGLTRYGKEEGKYEPGVASEWKLDEATNTYTFTLRKDAKWADGTQVTAEDFFFGWKLALDNAAQYGFLITDYVEGAEDYAALTKESFYAEKNATFKALVDKRDAEKDKEKKKVISAQITEEIGKMSAELNTEFQTKKTELWGKMGIKADGDKLSIKLSKPCTYFVGLTACPVYFPVNEKFYNAHPNDYALEAIGLNSNGPWIVKEWKHKDSFTLEKNPNYWNKKNIKIDKINLKVVTDVATRTNLLKTGAIDGSAIQATDLKTFQDQAVLDQYNLQDLKDMSDYSIFYLEFNHFNNKYTQNANVRKAISLALDRKGLVENVTMGDGAALALVPDYFPGLEKTFREENGKTLIEDNQKDKAKAALKAGLTELKIDKLPTIDLLTDQSDVGKRYAEKMQADLKEIGVDVNIVPVAWGDKLQRLKDGNFALCGSGWGPDYADPMTFLDLFESVNGNNHGKYNNAEFDKLIQSAKKEADSKKRMDSLYQAEKLLMNDMACVPTYFRMTHYTFKDYLTGVVTRGIGPTVDFYYADVDMSKKTAEKGK